MSKLGHAESFRDLVVYKNARKLAKSIFELTKSFPKEEMYSLTDQVQTIIAFCWSTDCRGMG